MKALFEPVRWLALFTVLTLPALAAGGNDPAGKAASGNSFDVRKYSLDIMLYQCFLTPYPKTFSAVLDVSFLADSTLSEIRLNANNNSLVVDSVRMAGVDFSHQANILTIALDRTYLPGDSATLRIYYRHKNTNDNGFYVSSGYVFTDSPPEGARKWMPCQDKPSDKALWELYAHVPANVRLGSAGTLADSTLHGDTLTYHWISRDPVATYLITITSSKYFNIHKKYWKNPSRPADSIPVLIYYRNGENFTGIDSTIFPITDFFSEKFGAYPFEKIGFATLNGSFPWGGMENQTMVNLMPGGYTDIDLIAHEHSHQWFGDLITCGTWADIWLNEGFGTYCQNLWLEHSAGQQAYQASMNSLASYYLAHNPGWSLYHPEWAIVTPNGNTLYNQAVTYNKGACVLFQLRYVLGDSLFFRVMKEYASDERFRFGNAVTADFVEKTTQVTGRDLSWFFDSWVYGPNHPVYQNTYEIDSTGPGNWRVPVTIRQTQSNASYFTMPVQILIDFEDGGDTLVQVMNDSNNQEFAFHFQRKPVGLAFDPNKKILLKQATTIYSIGDEKQSGRSGLRQNEPNPFRSATRITYDVAGRENVEISVYDNQGRLIDTPVKGFHSPGTFRFDWQGIGREPGLYLVKMTSGESSSSVRMILAD